MARTWKPIVLSNRQSAAVVFALGVLAGAVGYFTIDRQDVAEVVWRAVRSTRFEPDAIRWHLTGSKDPAVRALASRHIQAGDPVDVVIAEYGPFHIENYGRYTVLSDIQAGGLGGFEGYGIVAKDGRLVAAGWYTCVGGLKFFDTLTPAEAAEFIALRDTERERRHKEQWAGVMAAGGPLGVIALWGPVQPDPSP